MLLGLEALVADPVVLLDGLVLAEPRDLRHGVRLEDALHDQVVALLSDRRLLGEAGRDAVGDLGPLLERQVDGGVALAARVLGHGAVAAGVAGLD